MPKAIVLPLISLFLILLSLGRLDAQEQGAEPAVQAPPSASELAPADSAESYISGYRDRYVESETEMKQLWISLLGAREERDLRKVNETAFALEEIRTQLGYDNLENYSNELLAFAQKELDSQNREGAAFYLRKALQLSPSSPMLLLHAARVADKSGGSEFNGLYLKGLLQGVRQRHTLVASSIRVIYPLMWALTLGFLAAAIMYLSSSMARIIGVASTFAPGRIRGFVAAPAVSLLLIAPLFYGPIWCMAVWSIAALLATRDKQWLTFWGGALVCLWGLVIPIREHGAAWLGDHGVDTLLRVSSGVFQPGDEESLRVMLKQNQGSGAGWLALGEVLMRSGQYEHAHQALDRASRLMPSHSEPRHLLALISFLTGRSAEAADQMKQLESEGLGSAGFYFNYSKVQFDLLDTAASRELYDRANSIDRELVQNLQLKEEKLGLANPVTLALDRVPFTAVLRSALVSKTNSESQIAARCMNLMGFKRPLYISLLGAAIMLMFITFSTKRRLSRSSSYFSEYRLPPLLYGTLRLIPAGSLALNDRPSRCFLLCAVISLLTLPLIEWPVETQNLIHLLRGFELHYTFVFWFFVLACSYLGFNSFSSEDAEQR
ncbi:MAG: hypothetical protein J5J00_05240 [Deltaproteobacteria bacterium]|nr:hypothetical protein [Deltaproteobacteria bacterium]